MRRALTDPLSHRHLANQPLAADAYQQRDSSAGGIVGATSRKETRSRHGPLTVAITHLSDGLTAKRSANHGYRFQGENGATVGGNQGLLE